MRECITRLRLRWIASTFSQSSEGYLGSETMSSSRRDLTHAIFDIAVTRTQYSTLVEEWATTFYFQVHHEIKLERIKDRLWWTFGNHDYRPSQHPRRHVDI